MIGVSGERSDRLGSLARSVPSPGKPDSAPVNGSGTPSLLVLPRIICQAGHAGLAPVSHLAEGQYPAAVLPAVSAGLLARLVQAQGPLLSVTESGPR